VLAGLLTGDALHAVLCAAGYNIRWLLSAMVRLGLKAFYCACWRCSGLLLRSTRLPRRAIAALCGSLGREDQFCRADEVVVVVSALGIINLADALSRRPWNN